MIFDPFSSQWLPTTSVVKHIVNMSSTAAADPLVRTTQTLLLDSQIRDWVVLPLLVIMIAAGLLRANVGRLLRPPPKPIPFTDLRAKSVLLRSSRLRGGAGGYLSSQRWEARRLAWSTREEGSRGGEPGWLRLEATRAETDKKLQEAIKAQNDGENDNDPLASAIPGLDPSTMMVRLYIIPFIGIYYVVVMFCVTNNIIIYIAHF